MKRNLAVVAITLAVQLLVIAPASWYLGATSGSPVPVVFGQEARPAGPPPAESGSIASDPFGGPGIVKQEGYAAGPFTIDLCESLAYRGPQQLTIGGRVGPDTNRGQDVWLSRGTKVAKIATVQPDGTFQGTLVENFASVGQSVTVSIRPQGGVQGAWVASCRVERGLTAP